MTSSLHADWKTVAAEVMVSVPAADSLACARCEAPLLWREVALYTRLNPGQALDPWCVDCAYQMVSWAQLGANAVVLIEEH